MSKEQRGFKSMSEAEQRKIASKGGKTAHRKGTGHEWTVDEAREAGRKGGTRPGAGLGATETDQHPKAPTNVNRSNERE